MALTMQEQRHVGKKVAVRYIHACSTTGYSLPYAASLLRTSCKVGRPRAPRGPLRGTGSNTGTPTCLGEKRDHAPGQNPGASLPASRWAPSGNSRQRLLGTWRWTL